jgi:hypothetical protein
MCEENEKEREWKRDLPEDMVLLAQRNKENNKTRLESQILKISKCGLKQTKSLGGDDPMCPIYGGVKFERILVVGTP